MLSLAKMSMQRNIGVFVVVLGILVGGTWATVKITTDHLLYQNATSTARNWARYVAENVKDLEQIAAGEQPSSASIEFFQLAQRVGMVFRYKIFNRAGYSQLVSDRQQTAIVNLSEFNPNAALSVQTGQPVVAAEKEDQAGERPPFFAEAYVPVIVDRNPIAVVAAVVDQTEGGDPGL